MNELARILWFHLRYDGGLVRVKVGDLNRRLNRVPMDGLRYGSAAEALHNALTIHDYKA